MTISSTKSCQMATCTDVHLSGGEEQLLWYLLNISSFDNLQGPITLWVHHYHITSFRAAVVLIYHLSVHVSPCSLWKRKFCLQRQGPWLFFTFLHLHKKTIIYYSEFLIYYVNFLFLIFSIYSSHFLMNLILWQLFIFLVNLPQARPWSWPR